MKEYEFDPNNIEHCLERAEALKAKEEKQEVECMDNQNGEWISRAFQQPEFASEYRYRRKPTPVVRDWNQIADVPGPHCWLRNSGDTSEWNIIGITEDGVVVHDTLMRWSELRDHLHSTDRIVWTKCFTTEEPSLPMTLDEFRDRVKEAKR